MPSILEKLVYREATSLDGINAGTISEVFADFEMLPVKNSKSGARRSTIMFKKDGKVTNVILSATLTDAFRAGVVEKEHIVGFPMIWNEEKKQLFVGFPAEGWTKTATITAKDYVVKFDATNVSDII